MQFHQRLGQRQAQTRTLLGLGVLALDLFEGSGEPGQIVGGDADAGVLHADPHALAQRVLAALGAHGDQAAAGGELDGVGQQVQQHLFDGPVIGVDLGQVGEIQAQRQARSLGAVAHQPQGVFGDVLQRHRLEAQVHLARLDLRHVEDVVDQRQQVLAGD